MNANSFAVTYLESKVLAADPMELIQMLYDHALDMIQDGRDSLANGDAASRAKAISRAIAAVSELEASLDYNNGGEISRNLGGLYQYIRSRLTGANANQDTTALNEAHSLLATLRAAWFEVHTNQAPAAHSDPPRRNGLQEPVAYPDSLAPQSVGHTWSA